MKVYTIEQECEDYFYGYFITMLFEDKEEAEKEMKRLAERNKGNSYQLGEIDIIMKGQSIPVD